jgi:hypothetical protein
MLKAHQVLDFRSLRSDWYAGNQTLPRVVRQVVEGKRHLTFVNFPRHWLPIFHLLELPWNCTTDPPDYVPFFSDLSEGEILTVIRRTKSHRMLRSMVESVSICDPIISDFLYIFDNTVSANSSYFQAELNGFDKQPIGSRKRTLFLNGWQSYGRPGVRAIEHAVDSMSTSFTMAAVFPCSLKRPYHLSRTHKRLYAILRESGYDLSRLHRIVLTSLGVIPEEAWSLPQVLVYDAGVPDIYRILRLTRRYFKRTSYRVVLDCLQFEPYSDVLRIIEREGLIGTLIKIPTPRKRHFFLRHN